MSTGKENPVIVLVVILALVAYALWSMKNSPAVAPGVENNQVVVVPTTTGTNNGVVDINAPLSYGDALALYKNTRIQLNESCQASPTNVTYKNNTVIMIDNRAPVARTVKVNSVYTIPAYGFKVIKVSSAILPATWLIDCDKSQNVATILIQK